jgi:hypothetical protein
MKTDRGARQDIREWIIFASLLFLGMFLLQFAVQFAVALPLEWTIQADMNSKVNPDAQILLEVDNIIEPVLPAILTPPAWDYESLLTVEPEAIVVVPETAFENTATPISIVVAALEPTSQSGGNPVNPGNSDPPSGNGASTPTPTQILASEPSPSPSSQPPAVGNPSSTPTATSAASPTTEVITVNTPTSSPTTTIAAQPTQAPKPTQKPKPTPKPKPTKNK